MSPARSRGRRRPLATSKATHLIGSLHRGPDNRASKSRYCTSTVGYPHGFVRPLTTPTHQSLPQSSSKDSIAARPHLLQPAGNRTGSRLPQPRQHHGSPPALIRAFPLFSTASSPKPSNNPGAAVALASRHPSRPNVSAVASSAWLCFCCRPAERLSTKVGCGLERLNTEEVHGSALLGAHEDVETIQTACDTSGAPVVLRGTKRGRKGGGGGGDRQRETET